MTMTRCEDGEVTWLELGRFSFMEDEDVEGIRIGKRHFAVYRCHGHFYAEVHGRLR